MAADSRPGSNNHLVSNPWDLEKVRLALENAFVWVSVAVPGPHSIEAEQLAQDIIHQCIDPELLSTALIRFPGVETANQIWKALVAERKGYTLRRVAQLQFIPGGGEQSFIEDARSCLRAVQVFRTGLGNAPWDDPSWVNEEFCTLFVTKIVDAVGIYAPILRAKNAEDMIDEFEWILLGQEMCMRVDEIDIAEGERQAVRTWHER